MLLNSTSNPIHFVKGSKSWSNFEHGMEGLPPLSLNRLFCSQDRFRSVETIMCWGKEEGGRADHVPKCCREIRTYYLLVLWIFQFLRPFISIPKIFFDLFRCGDFVWDSKLSSPIINDENRNMSNSLTTINIYHILSSAGAAVRVTDGPDLEWEMGGKKEQLRKDNQRFTTSAL